MLGAAFMAFKRFTFLERAERVIQTVSEGPTEECDEEPGNMKPMKSMKPRTFSGAPSWFSCTSRFLERAERVIQTVSEGPN